MVLKSSLFGLILTTITFAQEPVRIRIHAQKPVGQQIPRSIFGSFLEPIGNSTYNGLWAEIAQNPSFEEDLWSASNVREMLAADPQLAAASQVALPLPWEPLRADQGNRYEPRRGDAANSNQSLAILGLRTVRLGFVRRSTCRFIA